MKDKTEGLSLNAEARFDLVESLRFAASALEREPHNTDVYILYAVLETIAAAEIRLNERD
jgi:hypothetical protein